MTSTAWSRLRYSWLDLMLYATRLRVKSRKPRFIFKRNGKRECARRRRQIERGMLTASNGLA